MSCLHERLHVSIGDAIKNRSAYQCDLDLVESSLRERGRNVAEVRTIARCAMTDAQLSADFGLDKCVHQTHSTTYEQRIKSQAEEMKRLLREVIGEKRASRTLKIALIRMGVIFALAEMAKHVERKRWFGSMLSIASRRPEAWYAMYDQPQQCSVYCIFSTGSSERYFGETKRNVKARFMDELRDAVKLRLRRKKGVRTTKLARVMAKVGPEEFVVIPVASLEKNATKQEREAVEYMYRKRYGASMNVGRSKRERKKSRKHDRRTNRLKGNVQPDVAYTIFDVEGDSGVMLDELIKKRKNGEMVKVKISGAVGNVDLTNAQRMQKRFGGSVIFQENENRVRVGEVGKLGWKRVMKLTNGEEFWLQIKQNDYISEVEQVVERIGDKKYAKKQFLRKRTIWELLEIKALIEKRLKGGKLERAGRIIQGYIRRRTGDKSWRPASLRIPYSEASESKSNGVNWVRSVISNLTLEKGAKQWLLATTKVREVRRKTIKELLVNNRRFAKGSGRVECVCGRGKHLRERMKNFSGLTGKIGRMNAGAIPRPGTRETEHLVLENAMVFLSQIASIMSKSGIRMRRVRTGRKRSAMTGWEQLDLKCAQMRMTGNTRDQIANQLRKGIECMMKGNASGRECVTVKDVHDVKMWWSGMIFSRIDKNTNQIVIECPCAANERLVNAFDENKSFEREARSQGAILKAMREEYMKEGLERVARWNEGGRLPYGYADPKEKAIEKTRGIVSMAAHPARRALKAVSRAAMWLLQQVPEGELGFTLLRINRLMERVSTLDKEFIQHVQEDGEYDMMVYQMDIDQMYTNLDKDQIRDAILWFFELVKNKGVKRAYRSSGLIAVKKGRSRGVRWGKADTADEIQLDYETMVNVMIYDLNNVYFAVRGKCMRQVKGVPIGGYLGAFFAIIQCAKAEMVFVDSLRESGVERTIRAMRYIDDALVWCKWRRGNEREEKNAKEAKNRLWTQVYTGGLSVKDVEVKHELADGRWIAVFIGAKVITQWNHVHVCPYLKNEESMKESKGQKIVMFQGSGSYGNEVHTFGTIVAALCRMEANSCSETDLRDAVNSIVIEFDHVGIQRRLVRKAFRRMAVRARGLRDPLKMMFRAFWSNVKLLPRVR